MPEDAEYRSPFKVPPPQCNDKRFAIEYPDSHAKYHNCPLHKNTTANEFAFANARLPVPDVSPEWTEWQRCREGYATAETDLARDLFYWGMLSCVSETNPPYADDLFKVPEQKRKDTTEPKAVSMLLDTPLLPVLLLCAMFVLFMIFL